MYPSFLLVLAACTVRMASGDARRRSPEEGEQGGTAAGPVAGLGLEPRAPEEQPGGDDVPLPSEPAALFDDSVLHTVAIALGEDARAALRDQPYDWVEGSAVIDGEATGTIGVRLRGKIGSFRTIDQKPKLKLDFNRYINQEFHDLEALALNNAVVDCSYIKEPAGYAVYHALGLQAPHSAFATVTIDGEDYGLYVLVEVPDDAFLDAWYEEPDGNLYDGKYLYYGGYNYELVDFTLRLQDNFVLEEGEEVGRADIYAVTDAVRDDSLAWDERMDPVLDIDQFHRVLVAEQWIGHCDGYALNRNNYRVYFNPWDGRAEIIPWDLDYAFIDPREWGFSWRQPTGALAKACWADEACYAAQGEAVLAATEAIDTAALLARIDGWTSLIAEAAASDPRRECRAAQVENGQEEVRAWVEEAPAELAAWWADP